MNGARGRLCAVAAAILMLTCIPKPEPCARDASAIAVDADPEMYRLEVPETLRFSVGDLEVRISRKAEYVLRAIPVSIKGYKGDSWRGKFSPCDVAAVWGKLADGDLYRELKWKQHGRWYYWRYGDDFGHDNSFVARYSSNSHMIPASDNLARALRRLKRRVPFEVSGYLVDVTARRGEFSYWWNSSLSLEDQGDGSCEVFYVTGLKYGGCVYQ